MLQIILARKLALFEKKVLVLHASPFHEGTNRSKLLGFKTN